MLLRVWLLSSQIVGWGNVFFYLKIDSKLRVYQNSKVLAIKKILDLSPSEARMICGKFIKKKNVTKSPIILPWI